MNMVQDLFDSVISNSISQGAQFLSFLFIATVIVAALIAIAFVLWHIKGIQDDREFIVTMESLGEQSEKIQALLDRMKVNRREKNYALLLLEEIMVRLHEASQGVVTAKVPVLVSKSVPTADSIALAEKYGLNLIFRAWKDSFEMYVQK